MVKNKKLVFLYGLLCYVTGAALEQIAGNVVEKILALAACLLFAYLIALLSKKIDDK